MDNPHTRARIDDLPTEILALIISSLGPLSVRTPNGLSFSIYESSRDRTSWVTCSCVSKRWRAITLPYLFKHLVVTDQFNPKHLLPKLLQSNATFAGVIRTLSICSQFLKTSTLSSILDLLPNLRCLDLDGLAFIASPHPAAVANTTSCSTSPSLDQQRRLQRLRYHGGKHSKPSDYTHVLSFLAQRGIRTVDVLEIRGPFTRLSFPINNNLLRNDPPSDLTMCTINELDVDVLPSAFISALELSNINNQGTITSLRVFLAKHTELPDLGGLIRTVGHNLVELSLDIRWAWTRCKTSTTLGGTSSGGDSLDIYKVPATLVSKALRKGFTALTNLRRLHLTLLNRDFVYRGFDDFGKSETVDEFEARAKIQAVHLIASIVELLPTPPPPSHDSTADAQRPGLLTHFSARITLSTWSTVPRSTFIPTPSSFDRIVLQPAWDRLQSALDIRCDDYTSVYVSLAGGSGATMIMKGGGFDCRWRKGENVLVSSDDGHSQSEH